MRLLIGFFLTLASAAFAAPATYVIYVSPTGLDTNGGTSASAPVKSASKVLSLARAKRATGDFPVQVVFAKGNYYGWKVAWDSFSKTYDTAFVPAAGLAIGDVILDGRLKASDTLGSTSYAFSFQFPGASVGGENTNLKFSNLVFQYYLEVMTFSGKDRNDLGVFSASNSITKCVFQRIGSMYAKIGNPPSMGLAVVRLVNSRLNAFVGNTFIDINNTNWADPDKVGQPYGGGQHAFYVAHHSQNNYFEGNRFERHNSGQPIKLRDDSSDNVIIRNHFVSGTSPSIYQWHCEYNERGDAEHNPGTGCSKTPPDEQYECLSYRNQERENIFPTSSSIDIWSYPSYACKPATLANQFQKESATQRTTGVIQQTGSYYGLCKNYDGCVNSANVCYDDLTGSDHLLCNQNVWFRCGLTENLYMKRGNQVCMPTANSTDAVWTSIPVGQFFIQSQAANSTYYGFCGTSNACVNGSGTCYNSLTGSDHLLCDTNNWVSCNLTVLASSGTTPIARGQGTSSYQVCKPTSGGADAIWTAVPSGKSFVISLASGQPHYAFCSTSTSCVNANDACYLNDTGSTHLWCQNTVWKSCNASSVGLKSGSKTCTAVGTDFVWK